MPRAGRTTIQDVARAAGVSTSSVSNYLNGRLRHLRPETRERIRRSIEALRYSPSVAARQLKTGHSPLVGLLIPSLANPYHAELALALEEASKAHAYRVVIGNGNRDAARERAFVDELCGYGVRGIIATSELRDPRVIRDYRRRGVAFVLFDLGRDDLGIPGVDLVSIDNALATSIAVDHLASLGHRRIAFVTATPPSANRLARRHGYEQALKRHGLGRPLVVDRDPATPVGGESNLAEYGRRVARRIAALDARPTAVIALNDIIAIGLAAGFHDAGLRVPADVSLVGIDDTELSRLFVPRLTTLRPDYPAMARQAIDYLHSRLAEPALPGRATILAPQLVVRESSAPPARASRAARALAPR